MYNVGIQQTTTTKEKIMNFNEICQLAELDRDEIYGIGTDNWEIYASDLVDTQEQEKQESEYRKLKRIKAENTANYRKQLETAESFEYNGHTDEIALHTAQQTFVGAMVKEGLIEFDDKF
jgi:hypothetical protein